MKKASEFIYRVQEVYWSVEGKGTKRVWVTLRVLGGGKLFVVNILNSGYFAGHVGEGGENVVLGFQGKMRCDPEKVTDVEESDRLKVLGGLGPGRCLVFAGTG